jgi:uncharacterized protein YkwD
MAGGLGLHRFRVCLLLPIAAAALAFTPAAAAREHHHNRRHHHYHHHPASARLANQSCPGASIAPSAANLQLAVRAVVCLVNRQRLADGLRPLCSNPHLAAAAQTYAQQMVREGFFSDTPPNGESLLERYNRAGYIPPPNAGYVLGENIAWGTLGASTPEAIVAAWMASPPHRANILNPRFRETGVGVVAAVPGGRGEGQPGATYVQEFGTILR